MEHEIRQVLVRTQWIQNPVSARIKDILETRKKRKKSQAGPLGHEGATILRGIDRGWILSGLAMS